MKPLYPISALTALIFLFSYQITAQTKNNKLELQTIDKSQYLASYSYEYQNDSSSRDSRRQTIMSLYIGNDLSKFENSNYFLMDSIWLNNQLKGQDKTQHIINQIMGNPTPMLAQYVIIKHKHNTQIDLYERVLSSNYHIQEKVNFKWNIKNTKDTLIAGYRCKEAQTIFRGRKYRAWYTLSIPINDGPYKFQGLPGLIVKIEDTLKEHCFELELFEEVKYTKPIYFLSGNYIKMEANDYPKLKHTEALARVKRVGSNQVQNLSQENMGTIEAKILRRNNLIERF